jgi:hypothetical protein
MVETTMFFTSADSPWCTLFKTVVIFVVSIMDQKLGVPQNGTLKISKYWGVYNIMGHLINIVLNLIIKLIYTKQ